jgi:hypothetical protein
MYTTNSIMHHNDLASLVEHIHRVVSLVRRQCKVDFKVDHLGFGGFRGYQALREAGRRETTQGSLYHMHKITSQGANGKLTLSPGLRVDGIGIEKTLPKGLR